MIATRDALDQAREAELDLVEVAPQAKPPVCRIMDYGKWKYAQKKKERKAKARRHETELKIVRIRTPKIGAHDLEIKVNHAREFFARGDRVQFVLRFRGREMAHVEVGREILDGVKAALADVAKVEQDYHMERRTLTMLLAPTAKSASQKPPKPPKPKPAAAQAKQSQPEAPAPPSPAEPPSPPPAAPASPPADPAPPPLAEPPSPPAEG